MKTMYGNQPEINSKKQQILLSFVYIHLLREYACLYRLIVY